MSEAFVIRPCDFVVCVDDTIPHPPDPLQARCRDRLQKGAIYLVSDVIWFRGEQALHIAGLDHRPTEGWRASRFRKRMTQDEADRLAAILTKIRQSDPDFPSLIITRSERLGGRQ